MLDIVMDEEITGLKCQPILRDHSKWAYGSRKKIVNKFFQERSEKNLTRSFQKMYMKDSNIDEKETMNIRSNYWDTLEELDSP